jgi:hypothetical protein
LYDNIKLLTRKYQKGSRPVKNIEGKTLNTKEEQMSRPIEHFKNILNQEAPVNTYLSLHYSSLPCWLQYMLLEAICFADLVLLLFNMLYCHLLAFYTLLFFSETMRNYLKVHYP